MKMKLGNLDVEMIHHDPIIFTVASIVSEPECNHLKNLAFKDMKRSTVSGFDKENQKRNLLDGRRTSSDCWIGHSHDEITEEVGNRIADLVQLPLVHAESFQVVYYQSTQEYQAHLDTFDPSIKEYSYYLKNGGQRIITALLYLNDVEEGGETNLNSGFSFFDVGAGVSFNYAKGESNIAAHDMFIVNVGFAFHHLNRSELTFSTIDNWYPKLVAPHSVVKPVKSDATIFFIPP